MTADICIECELPPRFDDDGLDDDGLCVECRLDAEALEADAPILERLINNGLNPVDALRALGYDAWWACRCDKPTACKPCAGRTVPVHTPDAPAALADLANDFARLMLAEGLDADDPDAPTALAELAKDFARRRVTR
jgi:hypothetical protein